MISRAEIANAAVGNIGKPPKRHWQSSFRLIDIPDRGCPPGSRADRRLQGMFGAIQGWQFEAKLSEAAGFVRPRATPQASTAQIIRLP